MYYNTFAFTSTGSQVHVHVHVLPTYNNVHVLFILLVHKLNTMYMYTEDVYVCIL